MQKQDFTSLLDRYLAGQTSPEEEVLLAHFFEQSGDPLKDTGLSQTDKERLFMNFSRSPRFSVPQPVVRKRTAWLSPLRSWSSAAVWVLVFGSALIFWLSQQKGAVSERTIVYQEVKTEKGKLLTVLLPDSSEIMLNANSTLRYHPDFIRHREVQLSGEALFKVQRDPAHPFRITTTDSLVTEVLGTEFNINSYSDLRRTQVTVLSGRVQVQKSQAVLGILTQHKAIVYDRLSGKSTEITTTANPSAISWTRGEWIYDGMDITDLKSLLANYYGITVHYPDTKGKTFSTGANMNFNQRQNGREIVDIFCAATGCRYKWKDATTVELF